MRKFQQFARHHFFQTVNLCDAVADFNDRADFRHGHAGIEILDLLANNFVNLVSFDRFHIIPF